MIIKLILSICLGFSSALPAVIRTQRQSQEQPASSNSTPIPIISQTEVIGSDGAFNFSYETANGIKVEESGYIKQEPNIQSRSEIEADEENSNIQVIQGSYSYTAPDGQIISLRYIADENGFQPEGSHIPTSPPIPEAIRKSLENEAQNNSIQPQEVSTLNYNQ